MLENFDKTYTPPLWDCLGFRFKEEDALYKINNITKTQHPLIKSLPNSKTKYHLIYNPACMAALVMKVTPKNNQAVIIEEIYPSSFSGRAPIYDTILNKIDNNKFYFSIYSNDKIILQSQVLLPPDQRDLLSFIDKNDKNIEIKENNHYNLIYYLLTSLVNIYPDFDSFKDAIKDKTDIYSDITENKDTEVKDFFNIAGQVYNCKIVLNRYTGRRFLEIEFAYNNTRFIVYTSTNSVVRLPKRNEYILCRMCRAQGEISPSDKTTSQIDESLPANNRPVLEFDVEYLYGYDNTIKFKKDDAFDSDIKIEYINIRLFENVIRLESAAFKDAGKRQKIFLSKDGNYEKEIEELKVLNFQEHRESPENLIEGRYWFIRYGDKYIEGFENTPSIIEDIKRIVGFDEIIDVIKFRYNQDQKKNNKKQ